MGTQKNAIYKVHNGTDFDEINFKTIAAQVKMSSGVDLESGFLNSKNANGYTKLPNGLIMQWGTIQFSNPNEGIFNGMYSARKVINFPISFPVVVAKIVVSSNTITNVCAATGNDRNSFTVFASMLVNQDISTGIDWIAIGY